MSEISKKIVIIHNGTLLFQFIDKTLRNTEGYDVVSIFNNEDASNYDLKDTTIDAILYDLKNEKDSPCFLNNSQNTSTSYKLSPREREVMILLSKGLLYKEIAKRLEITLGTLKQYSHIIYRKLGVSNKTEAINKYFNR